ncbi:hypothetical protein DFAR_710033 [Desulfarculales bacterium]
MKPPSSGFKSWPICIPSLSFRETPSQSCPSSWPARTTSPTSSYTEPPCPWPPGSWPKAIGPASPSRTCRPISCTTSKSQASNRNSSLIRPLPPYSRALAASSGGPTPWARVAIIAAAEEQAKAVSPEHVRIAATELI